jgi:F-type H+-transporting ATPase subunit alpha
MAIADIGHFEAALLTELRNNNTDLLDDIRDNDRKVEGELADNIKAVIEGVKKTLA